MLGNRLGEGARRWLGRWGLGRPGAGAAGFEVWAAATAGASLYAEAAGLGRDEALAFAAACRVRHPGTQVLVLDAVGAPIDFGRPRGC